MHICGDFLHDILTNGLLLLAFYPAWMPFSFKLKQWLHAHLHHL